MSDGEVGQDGATVSGFGALGVHPKIAEALVGLGYEEPTPVQRAAIPPLLEGKDVLALAATGTGKTAAFSLPLLTRIAEKGRRAGNGPGVLILVPTRELAMQVAEAVHRYGKPLGLQALAVYGGASMELQVRALRRGVDVVIATPGRAVDHIKRGTLVFDGLSAVVLDEADEMLDMGFAEELEAILDATPENKQTALFSATLPPRIGGIAQKHLRQPVHVKVEREVVAEGESARVRQVAYVVSRAHKMPALARVLDIEQPTSAIVFCRTRTEVDELSETLTARGLRAEALHGGLSQDQRDRVMQKFRARKVDLLIATDVAARGLDVKHVSHVVNFDVPVDAETYVHRIGRTGRAGREGVAVTFAEPRENRLLRNIERQTGQKIEIAQVPTVADLRAHRRELVRATLREAVLEGDLESWRGLVESLAGELDIMDVAAAAVKLVAARSEGEEAEIPAVTPRPDRGGERSFDRGDRGDRGGERGSREGARDLRGKPIGRESRGATGERSAKPRREPTWQAARLWIGAGRRLKMRPADLVGAIANEAGVDASQIGAIQIADGFSTVEVPETIAENVINALRGTKIKGLKVQVRRDRMGR
ncbi:MAG TPA: heavy metal transporter [Gemmatimonas aurantiaca]|uniref:ATP-dependent DEAD-box RNA helicase DeaD n=3 Tax=Gemmatimonas TaxID=173479 RepID=C1AE44_GEMAT|nr:DEAD/DEAH box helicase [Gemmatimonas aurantiaca]BAH40771.1 ATP-dependent DEAD-box RNA helicase DeaD [Gemmatimonas aurantiaca T-27]HCT59134.1 heavy metal transporter [Gemmatimonas aurantiaca]